MRRGLLAVLLGLLVGHGAWAEERVNVCHGYGCRVESEIVYSDARLDEVGAMLRSAVDAPDERKMLAVAIGRLYGWAGEQSDIHNDRAGNYADDYLPGRMDCIDHSLSTTRFLKLLEARGELRWHRVAERESRAWLRVIDNHWSAVIEENVDGEARRFVVDSWFVNNGEPAVILPLEAWKKGAGPDV